MFLLLIFDRSNDHNQNVHKHPYLFLTTRQKGMGALSGLSFFLIVLVYIFIKKIWSREDFSHFSTFLFLPKRTKNTSPLRFLYAGKLRKPYDPQRILCSGLLITGVWVVWIWMHHSSNGASFHRGGKSLPAST